MERARRAGPGWHVVLVKICGVTSEQDALVAVAMGADAVGFVFAPSPRQMTADAVGAITRRLPHETLAVGVFRDELPQRVVELAGRAGLRAVQLHGHESAEDVAYVKERVPLVIKALVAGEALGARAERYDVDAILLDASSPGTGRVFDWSLAEGSTYSRRVLLAGGLTPFNVAEAIAQVRPFGVDVSSGVELRPGRKDPRKIRAFVQAARAASHGLFDGSPRSDTDARSVTSSSSWPDTWPTSGPYDWEEEE